MTITEVIGGIEEVTPAWLTAVLRQNGVLSRGVVDHISVSSEAQGFSSKTHHIDVFYSGETGTHLPKRLFLKTSSPDLVPGDANPDYSRNEVLFYKDILEGDCPDYIIPCYSAVYGTASGASHILLKNVADTHETCADPVIVRNCFTAVGVLAKHHAHWWDHPRLGNGVGRFPSLEDRRREVLDSVKHTVAFMEELGDSLSPKWKRNYEEVLRALPRLFNRHASMRNLTLAHGDSHLGNFLFPKDKAIDRAYLTDWQFWHPTIAGTDLAFLIATEWDTAMRRKLERTLLLHYYEKLTNFGVRGYLWEDCWNDYRLSVILVCIFIPVWRWAIFKWPADMLTVDRSMTAFEDLNCSQLLIDATDTL